MSTTELEVHRTPAKITPALKAALVAAVTAGKSQAEVAKEFNLHRNTVSRACTEVRKIDHPSNPLSNQWRNTARTHAQQAVIAGLKHKRDPYRAANIGLDVLRGLGDLQVGAQVNIDQSQNIVFAWSAPVDPQDVVDAHIIDESTTSVSG